MQRISVGEFIARIQEADEWEVTHDPSTHQTFLTTWNRRDGSMVMHEEVFAGPKELGMPAEEFMAFHIALDELMHGGKGAQWRSTQRSGWS